MTNELRSPWTYFITIDLGTGWAPSVINSREEYDLFVTQKSRGVFIGDVWIGGSTDQDSYHDVLYEYYRNDTLGEYKTEKAQKLCKVPK